jgi:hypothetical protein
MQNLIDQTNAEWLGRITPAMAMQLITVELDLGENLFTLVFCSAYLVFGTFART